MDFLGLRTLTVIDDALRILAHSGVDLDLDAVPLDDPAVFELFAEGRTSGIFQFESSGMRELLQRVKPSKFEDLAAINALYRPGALSVGMVEEFIPVASAVRRRSRTSCPETRATLEETYGVIVYQEQVMRIAVEVAGFTLGAGRRAAQGDGEEERGGDGGAEGEVRRRRGFGNGFSAKKAEELWNYIEPFAGYGFNKSHSVAYAMLAYKTAYLKAHQPVAFMAAMLTSEMGSKDNVGKYIVECREMGIAVQPPDINESTWSFNVVDDQIRFGSRRGQGSRGGSRGGDPRVPHADRTSSGRWPSLPARSIRGRRTRRWSSV